MFLCFCFFIFLLFSKDKNSTKTIDSSPDDNNINVLDVTPTDVRLIYLNC